MSETQHLTLREYEISKESIRSTMSHLVTVSGTAITISLVIFKLVFDGGELTTAQTTPLLLMIILLMNLTFAFISYQNVQIIGLQRHIHSLELTLELSAVFRWESRVARIWYGSNRVTLLFNLLVGLPIVGLVAILYLALGAATDLPNWYWYVLVGNVAYVILLGLCVKEISARIETIIPLDD